MSLMEKIFRVLLLIKVLIKVKYGDFIEVAQGGRGRGFCGTYPQPLRVEIISSWKHKHKLTIQHRCYRYLIT